MEFRFGVWNKGHKTFSRSGWGRGDRIARGSSLIGLKKSYEHGVRSQSIQMIFNRQGHRKRLATFADVGKGLERGHFTTVIYSSFWC